jgi:hypothetical protein
VASDAAVSARTALSMRTTGQKYDDLSPLRHVVPAAARASSGVSAVIA